MATTAAGRQLTDGYRQRSLALRAATLRDLVALWPAFDLDDIDGSWQAILPGLTTLTLARHRDASGLAANYFRAFRTAETGGAARPRLADTPNRTLVAATLTLAGPIGAKKNISRGVRNVSETTLTRLSGTVGRQVLKGGRDTLTRSVRDDRQASGWRRITDSDPCDWCDDIAAQDVIGTDVDFEAHDHCGCTAEPAF